ncbi:hypothetical protein [Reinekea marinisedimentorum]|uniref:Uncharacterized protein n=1 Tax=Reinekea marinisedimentorum TaxID=230495 RepID=A0A4R3I801_9GAMM|nr:hypothetical protein [Reinekea marinisedimentorum]TCS42372.1 hypothetical protein BCF53_10333 [Reinekea marinisedimentorum]
MIRRSMMLLAALVSPLVFAETTTISSLEEFIDLMDESNLDIKMVAGTYHIDEAAKSYFEGGDWPANVANEAGEEDVWPGLFDFTGSNNSFDLTGVTFTFDSTIISDMPNAAHGILVELGGENNVWKGFNLEEVPDENGDYGVYSNISGGTILNITGSGHEFSDLTVKARFSRPYGFGSLYGKTGSSSGTLPNVRLGKKTAVFIDDVQDSSFENILIDHSGFGHVLAFNGPIDNVTVDGATLISETRSTDSLRENGIAGADRNGVPFGVRYNSVDLIGSEDNDEFFENFDTDNLDQCQSLSSGDQYAPIQEGYQFTLSEAAFRGYNMDEINSLTIRNAHVIGARSGIALSTAAGAIEVENFTATGIAGHGVPACDGAWNSDNGGEGDATAFGPSSNSVLINAAADSAYATVIELNEGQDNITADIQVLDPENGYFRPSDSTALALISGNQNAVRLWREDNSALEEDLIIKVGHSSNEASELLLCNMTQQAVTLSDTVTDSVIYSVGTVTDYSDGSNTVYQLGSASDEPELCQLIQTGYSRNNSEIAERDLQWGDQIFIAATGDNNYDSDCGWYGCQVGYMDDDKALQLASGNDDPDSFYLRQDPDESYGASCVEWGDKLVLAYTADTYETNSCGWYGCRVAELNDDASGLQFSHGGDDPASFVVRPPAGETASGCVSTQDEVVLAYSTQAYETSNCGWYGCRVVQYDGSDLVVAHGDDDPSGVYLRSWEQAFEDYEYEAPYQRDPRSWTLEDGKLIYSTGACFTYKGNGVFMLTDCDQVDSDWSLNSDNHLQWSSNPWGLEGGACYGYLGASDWGFDSCDDINTSFDEDNNEIHHDSNPWSYEGGACFDYLGGGEFGYINCDDF